MTSRPTREPDRVSLESAGSWATARTAKYSIQPQRTGESGAPVAREAPIRQDIIKSNKLALLAWRLWGARYQQIADGYGFSVSGVWKAIHKWRRTWRVKGCTSGRI